MDLVLRVRLLVFVEGESVEEMLFSEDERLSSRVCSVDTTFGKSDDEDWDSSPVITLIRFPIYVRFFKEHKNSEDT
jgi:hypothetical protein